MVVLRARFCALLALLICVVMAPLPALAQEHTQSGAQTGMHTGQRHEVESGSGLLWAWLRADPGDVIAIAPGASIMPLTLIWGGGTEEAPVTLTSADPENPARLRGLTLRDSAHVVIENLVFDYQFKVRDEIKARPFEVHDSRNIVLQNLVVDGDRAHGLDPLSEGLPAGYGIGVSGTDGLILRNSEIREFWRGLTMRESRNLQVVGNHLHTLRMDGMNFAQVQDVLIAENLIRSFDRSTDKRDHADMIQFWTAHTTEPSRRVTIRDNILNSEGGTFTQSIFLGNRVSNRENASEDMFYRDFIIENNLIINAHRHGIVLGPTIGARIANNSVLRNPTSEGDRESRALYRPIVSVAFKSRDVAIENNLAARLRVNEESGEWQVKNNFVVQDHQPARPNYYGKLFVGPDPTDPASFRPLPGGPLDGAGVGVNFATLDWYEGF